MSIRIGDRVRIEPRVGAPGASGCAVIALGEDRHRVLNPDRVVNVPAASGQTLARQAEQEIRELGSVVERRSGGRRVFDVVVYDLDASPMVRPEAVERGLDALISRLAEQAISRVAMEPIGMPHRGLRAEEFAPALRLACARAKAELEILLCHTDDDALDEIVRLLAAVH
jgi:hypothetical protein